MQGIRSLSASILAFFIVTITVGCGTPSHNPMAANGPLRVFTSSPPSIAALSPDNAPANSVPFTMEVDGANFDSDAIVFWNGNPLFTRSVNSQQLFADLRSTNLMLPGMVQVYVRTGGLNSNTVEFNLH
jgi:hypothetical protein